MTQVAADIKQRSWAPLYAQCRASLSNATLKD
jgi:hypothetical protein